MDTVQYHNGAGYVDLAGPPGPTHFMRAGRQSVSPRAVGDLLADTGDTVAWEGDWQYPTFVNGWSNYGGDYAPVRFRKIAGDVVIIEGLMTGGTATNTAWILPEGYRPSARVLGTIINSDNFNIGRCDIEADGRVLPYTSNSYTALQLTFVAEG